MRFSSENTWRISGVVKMSRKIVESRVVAGMRYSVSNHDTVIPMLSSPRKRGPIRRVAAMWHDGERIERSVAMGPRLRGDDNREDSPRDLAAPLTHGGQHHHDEDDGGGDDEGEADRPCDE